MQLCSIFFKSPVNVLTYFHNLEKNPLACNTWTIQFTSIFFRSPCSSFESKCLLAAAAAMSLQSCLTLCDPIDGSPPGSPIPGILQARTPEWVAISFSNAWKLKVKVKSLSHVRLLVTPWTAAHKLLCPWDFPGNSTGVGNACLVTLY